MHPRVPMAISRESASFLPRRGPRTSARAHETVLFSMTRLMLKGQFDRCWISGSPARLALLPVGVEDDHVFATLADTDVRNRDSHQRLESFYVGLSFAR